MNPVSSAPLSRPSLSDTGNPPTALGKRPVEAEEPVPRAKRPATDSLHSATHAISTSQASPLASFYKKEGKLSTLDIDAFLSQCDDQRYKTIRPENPAYYLRMVRRNAVIKTALRNLANPVCLEKIESLCKDIDKGEWSAVCHDYMERCHPDDHNLHDVRIKDMLLYAYAANRISRAEFYTALTRLDIEEQFEREKPPEYQFVDSNEFPNFSINTLAQQADVMEVKLFESINAGAKELSDGGYDYLSLASDNLTRLNEEKDCMPSGFDASDWFDRAKTACATIPENLQVFFQIAFTSQLPGSGDSPQRSNHNKYWEEQVSPLQMPFASMPLERSEHDLPGTFTRIICVPSPAVMQEFLELLKPNASVHPVHCLGTVGAETLADLHLRGFHPVLTRDDRVKTNLLAPHHVPAGALYAAMHDAHFHCMAATFYTKQQRQFLCSTVPFVVRNRIDDSSEFEKQVAHHMVAHFADLPRLAGKGVTLDEHVRDSFEFIANELAAGRVISGRSADSADHVNEARQNLRETEQWLKEVETRMTQ